MFQKIGRKKKLSILNFFRKRSRQKYWWQVAHWSSWLFVADAALVCFAFFVVLMTFNFYLLSNNPLLSLMMFLVAILVIMTGSILVWYKLGVVFALTFKKRRFKIIIPAVWFSLVPIFVILLLALSILALGQLAGGIGLLTLSFLLAVCSVGFLALISKFFIMAISMIIN